MYGGNCVKFAGFVPCVVVQFVNRFPFLFRFLFSVGLSFFLLAGFHGVVATTFGGREGRVLRASLQSSPQLMKS